MVLKWILEDNGKVLTATMNNPIGVVFKTRENGSGSDCEAWVGDTTRLGWQPNVCLVTVAHCREPFESDAAKAEAIKAFQSWAGSVFVVAASDGCGNWLYGLEPDNG